MEKNETAAATAIYRRTRISRTITKKLSCYPVKSVHEDGTVTIQQESNPCFLKNDIWNVNFFSNIKQFRGMIENYKICNLTTRFQFTSPTINLEVKYVYYHKLFNDDWSLGNVFGGQGRLLKCTQFLNEKYPNLYSLLDLEIAKVEREWIFWLREQDIVKFVTALRSGTASAESILKRFTRDTKHPTYLALCELGKAMKTIFLCEYLHSEDIRSEIQEGLNTVEQWNSVTTYIFYGKNSELRSNSLED